jgi:hypothetical protein
MGTTMRSLGFVAALRLAACADIYTPPYKDCYKTKLCDTSHGVAYACYKKKDRHFAQWYDSSNCGPHNCTHACIEA